MKKWLVSVLLVFIALQLEAQDIVILKDGRSVTAKVMEIDDNAVKYRLYDEPDGVVYNISKSEIREIRYESGRTETFVAGRNPDLFDTREENREFPGPGLAYREYRPYYRPSDYMPVYGEPYSPAWAGIASFFIPGLGQMVSGEVGRGCAFLGGTIGLGLLTGLGTAALFDNVAGTVVALVGSVAMLSVDIWAIVDAVQVAKVKNMYYRDVRQGYSLDMKIYPSVGYMPSSSGAQTSVGLALALEF